MNLDLPKTVVFKGAEEAADFLAQAEQFFLFALESVAIMEPGAIAPDFLAKHYDELSYLAAKREIPELVF